MSTQATTETSDKDLAQLPRADFLARLDTTSDGLTQEKVNARLARVGHNEIPEEEVNPLLKFLSFFWGPIPWMIEAAVVLSAVVGHWTDFGIILVLLLMNAVVGFWEEYQAAGAIAALKSKLALQARARRDGEWKSVPARDLVPGDVIRVRLGDIIPADARLLECDPVLIDQSALTGESLPVSHETGDVVYSGSVLKQGESDAVVFATGNNTFFGRTAHLVQTAHTTSHFQRAVLKIGDFLIVLAVALVVLILMFALFRGDDMLETFQFALVLTVAAVPVAMPTVLSVMMAVGARFLARKEAIVSRLASIEELAGMDVLCSDKTGTLTQNKLSLGEPFCAAGSDKQALLRAAALASRAEDQDPIDLAVLGGFEDSLAGYQVQHFQPFDPVHKRTEARVLQPDQQVVEFTKGAPQVVLDLCADADRQQAEQAINDFAARGFRSLGVARRQEPGHWQFLGVLPLFDPPRPDSKSTIATAKEIGIHVKMVTGDQLAIGREIAGQLGLGTNLLDARVLGEETARNAELIEQADGFAQVFPEHKYHIVDVLQERDHIVGMTGDGVNDAPALKKADAGIAVAGASDAARAAADIVLLTPGLSVIIDAIKIAREIFQRMNSYAIYRIAETIRVLLFMTLAILVFNFYPLTAVMIVLLALLNDGAILSIAYDRVRASNLPESWNMPRVLGVASVLGGIGVVESFLLFYLGERVFTLDRDTIQSLMYLKLSVAGHLTIFVTRTRGPFWSIRPAGLLLAAVGGTQLVATLIAVYGIFMAPLGWFWALVVWGYALTWFLIEDGAKLLAYRIFDLEAPGLLELTRHVRGATQATTSPSP
ncbi:MAG: plasma-membrane proton-efflux P-type ATPase [Gemmataceae bacterium]